MPDRTSRPLIIRSADPLLLPTTRRRFLSLLGVAGAIAMLPGILTGCEDADSLTDPTSNPFRLDLSTDTGILNYLYALEQVEAAFYSAAIASAGFGALSAYEQEVFGDLQKHEVIHREFLGQLLGADAIPSLEFNAETMGALTASDTALLRTAQFVEDTGVAAYNGAGKYLTTAVNLQVIGTIVSVEARHGAAIRDIRDVRAGNGGRSFAGDDLVDGAGLDVKAEPATVLDSVAGMNVTTSSLAVGTGPKGTPTADAPPPVPV